MGALGPVGDSSCDRHSLIRLWTCWGFGQVPKAAASGDGCLESACLPRGVSEPIGRYPSARHAVLVPADRGFGEADVALGRASDRSDNAWPTPCPILWDTLA